MSNLARLLVLVFSLSASAAIAAYQPAAVVGGLTVAQLKLGNFVNTPNLALCGYTSCNDGGDSALIPCVVTSTIPCTVDNGMVFQDAGGNKFVRNIMHGPVKLTYYGVTDARNCFANMAACSADAALTAAVVATAIYGDYTVTTAGRPIVLTGTATADFTIPQNVEFSCGGTSGALRPQSSSDSLKLYNLPNTIFVTPPFSITSADNSLYQNCVELNVFYVPGTTANYTIPPSTIRDIIGINHAFSGTASKCTGNGCKVLNVVSVGFDVGIQATGSGANICNNVSQDNNDIWVPSNGGGAQICNNDEIIFTNRNFSFRVFDYPITAIGNDGSGGIKITVDPTNIPGGMQIVAGDTLLNSGVQYLLQSSTRNTGRGDVTNGSGEVDNIMIVGRGTPSLGSTVTDTNSCIPANTTITSFTLNDDQTTYTMTMSANATCTKGSDLLSFIDTSVGPASTNGAKVVDHVNGNDVYLKGTSFVGPTFTGATWNAGYPVVKVYDPAATNVIEGQYMCASGTAPFGTAPSGWGAGTLSSSNINSLGTGIGTITVSGSQAGWAQSQGGGVFKVDSEIMAFTVINGTSLNITRRGLGGTTVVAHTNPGTLTTTCPQVTGVAKTEGAVTLAVSPTTSGTGTVQFGNDPTTFGTIMGQAELSTGYIPYSANLHGGNFYGSAIISPANGTSGGSTLTLSGNANWQHVYEGESVIGTNVTAGTIVDQTPTGNSIHLSLPLPANVSGDLVGFGTDGSCGYPGSVQGGTLQWWLGNCVGTAFGLGGYGTGTKIVQGIRFYSNHNFGHRNGARLIDAPATNIWGSILNSSGKPDGFDDSRAAIWFSGPSQKSSILGSRATTVIVDNTVQAGNDIALDALQIADNVVFAGGSVNYMAPKYGGVTALFPNVLVTSSATSVSIAGAAMQAYQLIPDSTTALAIIYCSSDSVFFGGSCAAVTNSSAMVATHATMTASFTFDGSAQIWPCDASGGTVVATIPAGLTNANRKWGLKKIDPSANACSLATTGTDTLDGVSGLPPLGSLNTQWQELDFFNANSATGAWYIQ